MTLFLSEKDIASLLSMNEAIESVEHVLAEMEFNKVQNQSRRRVSLKNTTLNIMSASLSSFNVLGAKNYTFSTKSDKPPVAQFLLFSGEGELLSLMEANELGRIRTGATTGVATKYLSIKNAKYAALLGTGFQAETQLKAMCKVRNLKQLNVWSRNKENAQKFCEKMQPEVDVTLKSVQSIEKAVENADIITTSTSSSMPILTGNMINEGVHINAIGSNRAYERELDSRIVEKASFIATDSLYQAREESGDLILAEKDNVEVWNRINSLSSLIISEAKGRESENDITLFKSNGIAAEDVSVAYYIYKKALKYNVGKEYN